MTDPAPPPTVEPEGSPPAEGLGPSAPVAGGCILLLLVPGAVFWLWIRERLDVLSDRAIGDHGPWVSLGAGLVIGLALCGGLQLLARYLSPYRRLEQRLARILGSMDDNRILVLALTTALGEELFFRLAAQDAFGLWGAAALYAVVNTGPGMWAWTVISAVVALLFGAMVDHGYGMLSVTSAHAIVTYLTLKRILPP